MYIDGELDPDRDDKITRSPCLRHVAGYDLRQERTVTDVQSA